MEIQTNDWLEPKQFPTVSLNALRAFEVTARHMSMKRAALELNLTPSAISHRLRLLEKTLGCRLFERTGSYLQLTDSGRQLAPALTAAFAQIMEAVGSVRRD